jgi:Icc-related predicted phosphoesterase
MEMLFVTDLHGSNECFKKFLTAMSQPNGPDVGIIGGDITNAEYIPFIKNVDGSYSGPNGLMAKDENAFNQLKKSMTDKGQYVFSMTDAEYGVLSNSEEAIRQKQKELTCTRLENWMAMADEVVKKTGRKILINAGNDDPDYIDDILRSKPHVIFPEAQAIDIGSGCTVFSIGYTNLTPWSTPRECSEEELTTRIDNCLQNKPDNTTCIFNFHCPPFKSKLDSSKNGHVGSKAVASAIKKYSPLLVLCGHIHEVSVVQEIDGATCINPGSRYDSSVLDGARIRIEGGRITSAIRTEEHGTFYKEKKKFFGLF